MERKYKESGIEWIGKIPEAWEVKRLKNLCTSNGSMIADGDWIESPDISDEGIRYYTTGNIGDGVFKNQGDGFISESTFNKLNCTAVYPGDLVFSRLNNPIGRACIIPNNYPICIVAVDNVIVRPDSKYDKRFLVYISMCPGYQETNMLIARGTTMQRMSRSQLQNVDMPIPPLADQQRIADYLDKKCGEINSLIALQEQMIEKLKAYKQSVITEAVTKGLNPNAKLVPSGIDWIGEIPEGWNLIRLKFLCTIQTGNQDTQDADKDGDYPFYVRSPQIERSHKYTFEGEGILMAGDGAGAGRVFHHAYGKYAVHQRVYRLANFHGIDTNYLFYFISSTFCKEMDRGSAQSTVPSVRLPMLTNFTICIPSISEQHCIASYLDSKCSDIDHLIALKQQKIESLKDYKKSVIYEAVTGKTTIE